MYLEVNTNMYNMCIVSSLDVKLCIRYITVSDHARVQPAELAFKLNFSLGLLTLVKSVIVISCTFPNVSFPCNGPLNCFLLICKR